MVYFSLGCMYFYLPTDPSFTYFKHATTKQKEIILFLIHYLKYFKTEKKKGFHPH